MKIQALLMVVLGVLAVGCSSDADPETTPSKTPSATVAEHDHSASEKTVSTTRIQRFGGLRWSMYGCGSPGWRRRN